MFCIIFISKQTSGKHYVRTNSCCKGFFVHRNDYGDFCRYSPILSYVCGSAATCLYVILVYVSVCFFMSAVNAILETYLAAKIITLQRFIYSSTNNSSCMHEGTSYSVFNSQH